MIQKSEKKLHILIIPSWYKTPETPVLGTFFEEQARALQRWGHQIGVLYPEFFPPSDMESMSGYNGYDFYVDNGIPTFNIKTKVGIPKMRKLSYRRFSTAVDRVFEDYVANFGTPDIIHAHSVFYGGIAALYIARKHNLPLVVTEHLTAFFMGYINFKTDIDVSREIFTRANASLIVSNNFKRDLEEKLHLPSNTFRVVHNLVNDLFFDLFIPRTRNSDEPFRFFTNSFLLPRKNIGMIIDAMKILTDKGHNVHLRIGGEGPEEQNLRAKVADLQLQNMIAFTGKLYRGDVKKELDDCHSFVLASQYETFGVVLIESLACGRPVVTTDSGGPRDFIGPDQGVIVHQYDAASLAEGMISVMKRYHEFNQPELISYCHENFSENKITREIIDIYHSVSGHSVCK
jgi:glycosyltransferase involved in cell wall biosynthesis